MLLALTRTAGQIPRHGGTHDPYDDHPWLLAAAQFARWLRPDRAAFGSAVPTGRHALWDAVREHSHRRHQLWRLRDCLRDRRAMPFGRVHRRLPARLHPLWRCLCGPDAQRDALWCLWQLPELDGGPCVRGGPGLCGRALYLSLSGGVFVLRGRVHRPFDRPQALRCELRGGRPGRHMRRGSGLLQRTMRAPLSRRVRRVRWPVH